MANGIVSFKSRMLHYKGDIMKKNPGKKADIVILKDAKAEAMKKAPNDVIARPPIPFIILLVRI